MTGKRVTEAELEVLRRYLAERDDLAKRMGVAVYEHMAFIEQCRERIKQSLIAEAQARGEIVARHGVHSGARASVDLATGNILED